MTRSKGLSSVTATPAGTSAQLLFHLGMLYCLGREVEQDYVAAQKWFNIAALKGSTEARHYRCKISREMTVSQIAEAQRQACAWISRN
jgi:TPR repeat protein